MARLAWVSLNVGTTPSPQIQGMELSSFRGLQPLLDQPQLFDVVVLDGPAEAMGEAALHLRSDRRYHLEIVYISRPGDTWCAALTDGEIPGDGTAIESAWQQWHERKLLFNRGQTPEQLDHTLLCWLWLRPGSTIKQVRAPGDRHIYRYPLVDAIASDQGLSSYGWLQQKRQENLLDAADLIDRIRQCTACSSSRLNYVDVCPECHSIDIVRQPSLHCFVCGHVAPQQDFLKGDALVCPNCLSQLRHIGSDYDRPMENYRCRSCAAFFVDADVDVHCIDCSKVNRPDELRVREIHSFKLSEAGALACRQGLKNNGDMNRYFRQLKLMDRGAFIEALNWQMAIAKRYGKAGNTDAISSLLGVRIENIQQVFATVGEARAGAMLEGLVERLQQIIRDTDRCTRGREDTLWLLLPHTPANGLDRVRERLVEGLKTINSDGRAELNLRFVGCVFPEQIQNEEDGALILARLAGDLS